MTDEAVPQNIDAWARATAQAHAEANPRPPMLTGPKRQHFLPQFYLDGFTRDGLVAVFDRHENEIRLQQPVNTAVIGHFYTMKDEEGRKRFELEAALAEFEGRAKPAIDKLVATGDLTAEERSNLSVFIALAAMRTPDMVNSVQALNGQMVGETAKVLFNDVDEVFKRLRAEKSEVDASDAELRKQAEWTVDMALSGKLEVETDEKWAVQMAMRMAVTTAPYLTGRHWRVVHRCEDKQSFITTDSPVYLGSVVPGPPSIYGVGFGSPDAFISFPLSQSCVLQMFGDTGALEHKVAPRELIRQANLALAERCQRFVVGRDAALVKSLAEHAGLAGKRWKPKMGLA